MSRGKSEGLKSGAFLPLISKERILGVLALSRFAAVPFSDDEIDFLTKVTRQVAIAVKNAREMALLPFTSR